MKHVKKYSEEDLSRISKWVRCIKDIKKFKKGVIYKINCYFGDPKRAIEEFNIKDYLPVCCISVVVIYFEGIHYNFSNSKANYVNRQTKESVGDFWEYFETLSKDEEDLIEKSEKYNL